MRNLLKVISGLVLGSSLLLVPELASAQDLGVRGEAGVAVPLTGPQVDRFNVGGDFAIKGVIGLGSYVDIGPMASVLAVPPASGGPDGTAWGLGGSLRLKRPHNEKNTGSGFTAVSPWVDGDLQYIRTGVLDRAGVSLGAGAAFPTSDARNIWVGPYARYLDILQDYRKGFDSTDAHVFIVGLSLELGPRAVKKSVIATPPPPPPVVQLPPPAPAPTPAPPPVVVEDKLELTAKVQFPWDSAKLDATALAVLDDAVAQMAAHKGFDVRVEGHASSEGQVAYNNKLSLKRAEAVVDYLVGKGIAKERLSVKGLGSSVPVATNKTEAGRAQNRRAEFVVTFSVKKEGK